MRYDEIEDILVERLDAVRDFGFELQVMPDTMNEVSRPATRSRITVAYKESRYGDKTSPGRPEILSMGIPDEEEFIEFSVIIESDKKRGQAGLYEGLFYSRKMLHGWDPGSGLARITSLTTAPIGYNEGFYSFEYTIQTSFKVVPFIDAQSRSFGPTAADAPPSIVPFTQGTVNNA